MGRCTRVATAVALAITSVLAAAAPAQARTAPTVVAIAAPAEQGLRYESHSVFAVDLPARAVHVKVDATVTNNEASYTSGGFIYESYFPTIAVPVVSEATNFAAHKDDGTNLDVTTDATDDPRVMVALVDLRPDLYYQQTQHVELDYDLPSQPPRSTGTTRVNPAFASFLAFGHGDPGLTTVEIDVPASLDTEIVGVTMQRAPRADQTVFTAPSIADPDSWTAAVNARDDSQLVTRSDTVDNRTIEIEAWPDDPAWADFVDQQLRTGLPGLKNLVGQPWPDGSTKLQVIETVAPYLYGYAGWYNPLDDTIEIGDALDPIVILHELAHTWFNKDTFSDRWVDEAFADEFAARALEKAGQPRPAPDAITPDSPGAFKLNDWGSPRFQDSSTAEQEQFGYNAAWTVLRAIDDEIGPDALAKVVDAAANDLIAYRGHPAPEKAVNSTDWRRLLDLFEEVGGSKQAETVFAQYVVGLADAPKLAERAKARRDYQAFVAASGDWSAPLALRSAMGEWEFDRAQELMKQARDILATRDQIAATLQPLGLRVPKTLQDHYESAGAIDMDQLAVEANRDLDAARHLVDADKAVHAGHGILGTFGLLFAGADDKLADAKAALDKSDATTAIARADSARDLADNATATGIIRLVALLLVALGFYAAWTWGGPYARGRLAARAEHRRQRAATQVPPPVFSGWAPPAPPPQFPSAPPGDGIWAEHAGLPSAHGLRPDADRQAPHDDALGP